MTTVVTGFSPSGYRLYGARFLETFNRHWPRAADLKVYTESQIVPLPRGEIRDVLAIDGLAAFLDRHAGVPEHCGRKPNRFWRPKDLAVGYNFRFDAVKFCRQCFIPQHAAQSLNDGQVLCWSDADVVTFRDIPDDFAASQLDGSDLCYLGRGDKHSEIGFWATRLNSRTRAFLAELADLFRTDHIFEMREWHSAFAFDVCRERFVEAGGKARDMTPGGLGHVWFQSELGRYMDHLKGDRRKKIGHSEEAKALKATA